MQIIFILVFSLSAMSQMIPVIRTGLNFGTINQEWYTGSDSIRYGRILVRPIIGFGLNYPISEKFSVQQEIMYQTKGQGTPRPNVRTGFSTENPDILHFISFPLSLKYQISTYVFLGLGFQPSLYLSGKDNYYAREKWAGWIYSGILNFGYNFTDHIKIGFDYDYDFMLYYCPQCDIRFNTYRLYAQIGL